MANYCKEVVIFKGRKLTVWYWLMPTKESVENEPELEEEFEVGPQNSYIDIRKLLDEKGERLDPKSPEFEGLAEMIKQIFFSSC